MATRRGRTPRKTYAARTVADITRTCLLYKEVRSNLTAILGGRILSVDPSCGSRSSMPGWAYYTEGGKLEGSGILKLDYEKELNYRLHTLLVDLQEWAGDVDVLVYEDIAPRRYGGGGAHGHASLLKSVGVVMSALPVVAAIGVKPTQWKKLASAGYVKSDEADAREMGRIVIDLARHIAATNPPRGWKRAEEILI